MSKATYGIAPARVASGRRGPGPLDEKRARLLPVIMGLAGLVSVGMLAAPVPGVGLGSRVLVGALCAPVLVAVPVALVMIPLHRYGHDRSVLRDHLAPRVRWVMAAMGVGALLISVVPLVVPFGLIGVPVLLMGAVGVSLLGTGTVLFLLAKGML